MVQNPKRSQEGRIEKKTRVEKASINRHGLFDAGEQTS